MLQPAAGLSWQRYRLGLCLVLATLLCFAGLGRSLWGPDEPAGAAIGRAMVEGGDLVVPRLNGQPFLEKPPLYWWVQVPALRAFGFRPGAARLPSALFGAATLLIAYALGRRLGQRSALLAPLVLSTVVLFFDVTHRVEVDPALMFFVALAHLGFVVFAEASSRHEWAWGIGLIAVALPLAFLCKGVVALALGAAPPMLYLLATRRRRRDLLPLVAIAAAVFVPIALPWLVLLQREAGWRALRELLLTNTAGRALPTAAGVVYGHRQGPTYYLAIAPVMLLPWSLALPAMLRAGVLRRADGIRGAEARRLLFTTTALGVLLLSLAATKRELYLLPLLPAFAACVSWWLGGVGDPDRARDWDRRTLLLILGLAAALPVVLWAVALQAALDPPLALRLRPIQEALSPVVLAVSGAVALAIALPVVLQLGRHLRRGSSPPPEPVILPYLVLLLTVGTAVAAALDPAKSLVDFTAAISRLVPPPGPVPAYLPPDRSSESLLGIVDFELGRHTEPLTSTAALGSYFAGHPGARVVFRMDDALKLPTEVRRRLRFLYDETGVKAMSGGVAEWREPPGPRNRGPARAHRR